MDFYYSLLRPFYYWPGDGIYLLQGIPKVEKRDQGIKRDVE